MALNSKIDWLEAVLAKTNGNQDSKPNNQNNSRSGWKITVPKQGEPWTKTVNGKESHWCKFHNFGITQHNLKNCRKGLKLQEDKSANSEPNLRLILQQLTMTYQIHYTS